MAFPTNSVVLDDFNRTNGTAGANWSLAHSFVGSALFQIQTSRAVPSNDYVIGYWNPGTYGPDCEVWATIVTQTTAAGDGPYFCLRLQQVGTGTLDGYCLSVENSGADWKINKITNGVLTALGATVNGGLTNGDKVGLEAIGTTLTAYRKSGAGAWTQILQRTDATYGAAGYLGMYIGADQNTTKIDDFGGGPAVAASVSLAVPTIARRMHHLLVR